jgi:TRAP-type C4-dicarboxylate transport system permease small subunit
MKDADVQNLERILEFIVRWIVKICEWMTITIGGWLGFILVVAVFFRYVLNRSLTWSAESSTFLLVWLMLSVAPLGFHEGIHISVDVVVNRFPGPLRRVMGIFINLSAFFLFAVTGYYGIFLAIDHFGTELASIPIKQGWFTSFLPVSCLFVLFVCLNNIVKIIRTGNALIPETDKGNDTC